MPIEVTRWLCDICKTEHDDHKKAEDCCQIKDLKMKRRFCDGCENDYYNKNQEGGCWSLESARRVLKKEVHVDQVPPWNQEPIIVLSCFHRKRYVYVGPEQTC